MPESLPLPPLVRYGARVVFLRGRWRTEEQQWAGVCWIAHDGTPSRPFAVDKDLLYADVQELEGQSVRLAWSGPGQLMALPPLVMCQGQAAFLRHWRQDRQGRWWAELTRNLPGASIAADGSHLLSGYVPATGVQAFDDQDYRRVPRLRPGRPTTDTPAPSR